MSYFFTNYMPRCCFCRTLALDLICFYLLLDWNSTGDEDSLPSREQRVVKQTVKLKMKSHKDLRFQKKNIENDKVQVYMCLFKMFQVYFLFAILSGLFFQSPFSRKKKKKKLYTKLKLEELLGEQSSFSSGFDFRNLDLAEMYCT